MVVKGFKMAREAIDYFQRTLDESLKHFNPSVKGHEYSINFVPVSYEDTKKVIARDFYMIEVHVNVSNFETVYFSNYDECWIKRPDGNVERLPVVNIRLLTLFYKDSLYNFKAHIMKSS